MIENYPEDREEFFELPNNPNDADAGTRKVAFSRELYIDRSDFALEPPPKFFRLKPGGEVRLMGAYIIRCNQVIQDESGEIVELRCSCDLATGNGNPVDGRKVKGTIHWVSAAHCVDALLCLYDRLFTVDNLIELPEGESYLDYLNPQSLTVCEHAKLEASLADAKPGDRFQFVRMGYFCKDTRNQNSFNRTVTLKDSFKPQQK